MFKAENYDPVAWSKLFREAGARYVIPVVKHHEGFCLWGCPDNKGWNAVDAGPKRDLVAPLADAVGKQGIKLGLYMSMLEWNYGDSLPGNKYPPGSADYVTNHHLLQIKDLVNKYHPYILWPDGEWDQSSSYWRSEEFLAWYANNAVNKDSVLWNDRWGSETRGKHGGVYITENGGYGMPGGPHPWEECRSIGGSYGYNSWYKDLDASYPSSQNLLDLFVKALSQGGNFLLNVGPKADGTLIAVFQDRLRAFGRFLKANGEGVYSSRLPYMSAMANTVPGDSILFTRHKSNQFIYAFFKTKPGNSIIIKNVGARTGGKVYLLADSNKTPLTWSNTGGNLNIQISNAILNLGEFYWVFRIPGGFNADSTRVTSAVEITSFKEGDTLKAGSTCTITWITTGTVTGNLPIRYLSNGTSTSITNNGTNGTYSWTVPNSLSGNFQLQVGAGNGAGKVGLFAKQGVGALWNGKAPAVDMKVFSFRGTGMLFDSDISEVLIADVKGRLVTRVVLNAKTTTWNGQNSLGRNVSPGIYFVHPAGGGKQTSGNRFFVR